MAFGGGSTAFGGGSTASGGGSTVFGGGTWRNEAKTKLKVHSIFAIVSEYADFWEELLLVVCLNVDAVRWGD